jgi:hypothetical protein
MHCFVTSRYEFMICLGCCSKQMITHLSEGFYDLLDSFLLLPVKGLCHCVHVVARSVEFAKIALWETTREPGVSFSIRCFQVCIGAIIRMCAQRMLVHSCTPQSLFCSPELTWMFVHSFSSISPWPSLTRLPISAHYNARS